MGEKPSEKIEKKTKKKLPKTPDVISTSSSGIDRSSVASPKPKRSKTLDTRTKKAEKDRRKKLNFTDVVKQTEDTKTLTDMGSSITSTNDASENATEEITQGKLAQPAVASKATASWPMEVDSTEHP